MFVNELNDKEVIELFCPKCDEQLVVFSNCECGVDLLSLFLNEDLCFIEAAAQYAQESIVLMHRLEAVLK